MAPFHPTSEFGSPNPASPPLAFTSVDQLEALLAEPRPVLVDFIRQVRGPLLILGAGGKMGPTLAMLARRAAVAANHSLRIIAASRFTDSAARQRLENEGIETASCDLLDPAALAALPESDQIIYLVGLKFGTSTNPASTWAMNTIVPGNVCRRFPQARIVSLSTGNVYSLVPADSEGSRESDRVEPVGEYPNAALARERIFQFYSERLGNPVVLLRLNYALDLRYGVLVDIGRKVFHGEPVDLTMGYVNCIWQGNANEFILRSIPLAATPPVILNLTGTGRLSVRRLAEQFGEIFGRPPRFIGEEAATALLSNVELMRKQLGAPATPIEQVLCWTAQWIQSGKPLLNKPTSFQIRDGKF